MTFTCAINTPLGMMSAAAEDGALTGLWFVGQKYYPPKAEEWITKSDYPVFKALNRWLDSYFAGNNPSRNFRLAAGGTDFQKAVWEILLTIPYGQLTTYGGIAKRLAAARGLPAMSAQAVGGAVGHNPVSLLIPCHRVIGSAGGLTGYAAGIDKKKALLQLEGAEPAAPRFIP
jgi:methylated-DNA-[protein]-cysteine S-methyltransferase